MGHVDFDPGSISVEQMAPSSVQQIGAGRGRRSGVIPLVNKAPPADIDPIPVEEKTEAIKEVEDKPKEVRKATTIKAPGKDKRTVIVKPCDVDGRACSTLVPSKKRKSDSLGLY